MGVVRAWLLLVGGRSSRWQDRRCDGVVLLVGGGLLVSYFLGVPRTHRPGDILVGCRPTAESGPGAGRVREGGEVISRLGLGRRDTPPRALVKSRLVTRPCGGGLESGYLCCSVCSVCRFALLACFKTVQLHNKPAVTPAPEYQQKQEATQTTLHGLECTSEKRK